MLADVFENFRNKCLEIYELDPTIFFFSSWISMASYFEKTKVKLDLLTDINMLLIVEKGIRGGICHYAYMHIYMQNLIKIQKRL